jgi:serum/glucocorticoid-regulated kinase 2
LLYELVTGLPPFYSRDENEIKEAIVNQELTFPSRVPLSNEIKLLLKGLLAKNQKLRLGSLKGVKEILFHPWLGRVNSEMVINKQLISPYVPDINEFNFDENELGDD